MELNEIQKQVWDNKLKKGFNTENVYKEFCYIYGEVGEAYDAWLKKKDDLGLELADIGLYLCGLAEMLGFSLQEQMEKKLEINKNRVYVKDENGVLKKVGKKD